MSTPPPQAASAAPLTKIRLHGDLVRKIPLEAAEELVTRGRGRWQGIGKSRFVALDPNISLPSRSYWWNRKTTRRVRADGSCRHHLPGEVIGDRRSNLEFIG